MRKANYNLSVVKIRDERLKTSINEKSATDNKQNRTLTSCNK